MEGFNYANMHHIHAESQQVLGKASVAHRLGAFMIDHVIISFVLVALSMLMLILFVGIGDVPGSIDVAPDITVSAAFPIFMLVSFFVYGLKDIVNGQSIGKRALGIAVRDRYDTSQTPSAGKLFLRNVFMFLWPIDFFVLACSAERTKIGDKLAGTDVYRISKKPKVLTIIIAAVLAFVIFVGALFFGVLAIIKNHPAYHAAIHYIEANPRVAELVGDIEGFGSFPGGSVSTSGGHGQAEFTIRVVGSDNTIHVHIRLEREPLRDWEVVGFHYRR